MSKRTKQPDFLVKVSDDNFYCDSDFLYYKDRCCVSLFSIKVLLPFSYVNSNDGELSPSIILFFTTSIFKPIYFLFDSESLRDKALAKLMSLLSDVNHQFDFPNEDSISEDPLKAKVKELLQKGYSANKIQQELKRDRNRILDLCRTIKAENEVDIP